MPLNSHSFFLFYKITKHEINDKQILKCEPYLAIYKLVLSMLNGNWIQCVFDSFYEKLNRQITFKNPELCRFNLELRIFNSTKFRVLNFSIRVSKFLFLFKTECENKVKWYK